MSTQIRTSSLVNVEVISGLLLILSFAVAICISNIDTWSQSYKNFVFYPISFGYGTFIYKSHLIKLANDWLMAFFFLLIGLELKFHLVCGEYQERKTLILPTAAALGGIIFPALIYIYFNFGIPTMKGWAIPIATDTAFALGVLSLFGKHISTKLRAFIISFSLIDDALALLILAIFYTHSSNIYAVVVSSVLIFILLVLNRCKVKSSIYYLFVGIFLWVSLVEAGVHGTICGVILALAIPVQIDGIRNSSFRRLENILRPIVYFFILPLFVFLNSGINFDSFSREVLTSNITLGIIVGLFIGKPLGILSFTFGAIKMKWCSLPHQVHLKQFIAIAVLGGIGFTLSLFIGDLAFHDIATNYAMRAGVIIGSLLSTALGVIILISTVSRPR